MRLTIKYENPAGLAEMLTLWDFCIFESIAIINWCQAPSLTWFHISQKVILLWCFLYCIIDG